MKKAIATLIGLGVGFIFLLAACNGGSSSSNENINETASAPEGVIVIGDISDDPGEVIEGAQPLADYLASKLGNFGISSGKVRVATTANEMSVLLQNGEVDIYFDSIYPATLVNDALGARVFLRRWRFGVEEYHSVIFASVESGITSLEQLAGKTVAFDSPYSTSGYLLPAVTLIESGLALGPVASPGQVGIVFSYDDENTLQWVLTGRADAGATDDFNWDVVFADVRDELVLLDMTEDVPRQVAVARPGLSQDYLDAITDVLIGMDEDPQAAEALDAFQTTQFDKFPQGIDAALARMREMIDLVSGVNVP
jgi:phosphonate transport system substrate-binding protein